MMMMTTRLTGQKPLLMHNEQLANPLADVVQRMKPLTAKRKKTDADYREIAEIEFEGGLYFDDEMGPVIPGRCFRAVLIGAARKSKLGKQVEEAAFPMENAYRLQYDGPRTVKGLWQKRFYDQRMVGNQKGRVLRTRPMFRDWSVEVTVMFDETVIDERTLESIWTRAEKLGLCDYRPLYGTFTSKKISCVSLDVGLKDAA